MRYKVGDVVKLRDDLEINKKYGGITFTNYKNEFKNESIKVIEISEGDDTYRIIDEDNNAVWISGEMIEGLWEECKGITYEPYEEKTNKYKLIDILNKIANGELKEGAKFVYRRNMYIWEDNIILNTSNSEPFDIADRSDLNMELELIEPQEPTECEHEWKNYGMYNTKTKECKYFRKCIKCDLEEEIEPTDNTKIEELDEDNYQGEPIQKIIADMFDKLNEVIRKINKEG